MTLRSFAAAAVMLLALQAQASVAHADAAGASDKEADEEADEDADKDPESTALMGEESDEARHLFLAGQGAYNAGRFEEALDLFERSYRLSKQHELLYDIALAADRLRHDEQAVAAYERFLEHAEDPEHRVNAIARLKILRAAMARAEHPEPKPVPAIMPRDAAQASHRNAAQASHSNEDSQRWSGDDSAQRDRDDGSSVLEQWWFWAAVGTVVAGGAAVGVWALTREQGETANGPTPNTGVSIPTLTLAP